MKNIPCIIARLNSTSEGLIERLDRSGEMMYPLSIVFSETLSGSNHRSGKLSERAAPAGPGARLLHVFCMTASLAANELNYKTRRVGKWANVATEDIVGKEVTLLEMNSQ